MISRLQPIYCMSCVAAVTEGFQSAFEASKGVNFATDGIQFLRLKEKGDYVVSLSTRPRAGYWL
ncbi:hypothetical protein, partial [Vibrio cholerae]|uniref:hypothetical protein n=1 Tax=Vibrio cholerae TaxID=666 RepID=UPI001F3DE1E8